MVLFPTNTKNPVKFSNDYLTDKRQDVASASVQWTVLIVETTVVSVNAAPALRKNIVIVIEVWVEKWIVLEK